jgi:hypothetical protein
MKTFSKIEISVIKSTAKNVAPFVAKKAKVDVQIAETKEKIQKMLEEKLQKLEAEKAGYQSIIDSMNQAVKQITGGYTTEDLVSVTKEGTGQMGENGKEIMKTCYNLKYPDTVIPVTAEEPACPTHEESETPIQEPAEDMTVVNSSAVDNTIVVSNSPADTTTTEDPFSNL